MLTFELPQTLISAEPRVFEKKKGSSKVNIGSSKVTISGFFFHRENKGKKGKMRRKRFRLPDFALMGCFPVDFQEVKRPLRTKSWKRAIKVGKRPTKEGKRSMKAMVLVGISVCCLIGCFRAPPPWRKTAPLKRPERKTVNRCR